MTVLRLLAINGLIRVAAAGSGQLFAFLLAERLAGSAGTGSLLVGGLGAAFFATELLGAPIAGRLADRHGQQRILRFGPLFGIVSALVAAAAAFSAGQLAVLAVVLLLARLNEGASAACAVPTTLVLMARTTADDPARRMRVMGAFEVTSLAGMIAGYILMGLAWDAAGVGAFLLLPPIYGVAWLLVGPETGGVPTAEDPTATVLVTLRRLATVPGNIAFGVAWLAVNAVVGVWIQQAPFLLKLPDRATDQALVGGLDGGRIGLIFAVWGLLFLIGIGLWSWLAAARPRRRSMAWAMAGLLGVVVTLALFNHGGSRLLLVLAGLFVLVESGFTPAAFAHVADLTERLDASRGTALGLYAFLLGLGQLAGTVIGAPFAARWQMDGVLLLTGLLALVALVAVARIRPPTR